MVNVAKATLLPFVSTTFHALALLLLDTSKAQQKPYCDSRLPIVRADPWHYRWRSNRCEGRTGRPIGGHAIELVDLSEGGSKTADIKTQMAVRLSWPQIDSTVVIKGVSTRLRDYYRLEYRDEARAGTMVWNQEVPTGLNLRSSDVGLVAYVGTSGMLATQIMPVKRSDFPDSVLTVALRLNSGFDSAFATLSDDHSRVVWSFAAKRSDIMGNIWRFVLPKRSGSYKLFIATRSARDAAAQTWNLLVR
jgi:hypothetical protein